MVFNSRVSACCVGMNQNYAGYGGQPGPQMVPQQQLMGQSGQGMMGGFPGQQGGGFVSQQQPPGMMGTGGPIPPQQPRGAGEYMGPQGGMTAQQRAMAVQQGARPPYLQASTSGYIHCLCVTSVNISSYFVGWDMNFLQNPFCAVIFRF